MSLNMLRCTDSLYGLYLAHHCILVVVCTLHIKHKVAPDPHLAKYWPETLCTYQECGVSYTARLTNGTSLDLEVYVVYDMPEPTDGGDNRLQSPLQAAMGAPQGFHWTPVQRSDCTKGCKVWFPAHLPQNALRLNHCRSNIATME